MICLLQKSVIFTVIVLIFLIKCDSLSHRHLSRYGQLKYNRSYGQSECTENCEEHIAKARWAYKQHKRYPHMGHWQRRFCARIDWYINCLQGCGSMNDQIRGELMTEFPNYKAICKQFRLASHRKGLH